MKNLEIGKRIRTLRTEKGLSREAFCGDEKELTVRQLGRIETGNNLPSLAKLDYIAEVLGVPMSQLIDEGLLIVPKEYLKLKTKLIRQSIHGDEEKIHQREAIFEEIQERFYDQLPEDEQVSVEVLQAIDDVYVSENAEFGEGLIEEYFNQTLLQTEYSVNDLLILYLYFLSNAISFKRNDDVLKKVRNNIVTIIDCSDNTYMHLLQRVLIAILLYQLRNEYYEDISVIFSFLREIMMEIQDSNLKPTVDYLEAKYYLYGEKDKEKALQYYEKAISGAEFFNDINFKNRVIEEMKEEFPDM
ncbi:XRE family transcriptional regulator [uncultured Streptococcus sp.]|uniref:helix-turn-helix domain-containing protein n=1 Tax=uncultured Streptococcus sp. TaxID=83427 RepID=UPI001A580758|nr:XRE family transcriptional regulator [uncultured Streptococcus sp.]VTY13814.1 Helix-turn-helix domain protein [uncultured Streptococcus sp.]